MLLAYKLKLISNNIAKERQIAYFFKGFDINRFQLIADKYSIEQIDKIIRPKAFEKIKWHQKNGHKNCNSVGIHTGMALRMVRNE